MIFTINTPFYIVSASLILICIIYILFITIIVPIFKKNRVLKEIDKKAKEKNLTYSIIKDNKDAASFKLIINDVSFLIRLVDAKKNCEVQITNNKHFVVYNKDLSGNLKMNIIENIGPFISSLEENRIILVNNSIKSMVRAVNENEIKKITSNDAIFGLHILSYNNLDYIFSKCEK